MSPSTTPQTQTLENTPGRNIKNVFQQLPIKEIRESKTNPREHYNSTALADLTLSIQQFGILEPLLVRQEKTGASRSFEIISGARRYRAAKAAGLELVPCITMDVTDEQVLEIHVIENLQRADLHPLEEAEGYHALMSPPHRQPVERLAERIGRSVKYIYDRVKLLDLIKPIRDVFWTNEITAGHGILLARIPADHQKRILEDLGDGLFHEEHLLFDPEEEDQAEKPHLHRRCISVRELEALIDRTVRFKPKDAVPLLYPETAKVLEVQPKDEKVLPITYEYVLEDTARDSAAKTLGPRSWVRADGQHDSKVCEHSELGLVVAGPRRGEAFKVCREKHKCTIHYGKEIRARAQAEKQKTTGNGTTDHKAKVDNAEAREKAKELLETRKREIWDKARPDIAKAIEARVKTMPTKLNGLLSQVIISAVDSGGWGERKIRCVMPGTSAEDVVRLAAYILLVRESSNAYHAPREFPKRAKALGIDLDKILKAHTPAPEKPATPAAKPATKSGAARSKEA